MRGSVSKHTVDGLRGATPECARHTLFCYTSPTVTVTKDNGFPGLGLLCRGHTRMRWGLYPPLCLAVTLNTM